MTEFKGRTLQQIQQAELMDHIIVPDKGSMEKQPPRFRNPDYALRVIGERRDPTAIEPLLKFMEFHAWTPPRCSPYQKKAAEVFAKILSDKPNVEKQLGIAKSTEIYAGVDKGLAAVPPMRRLSLSR